MRINNKNNESKKTKPEPEDSVESNAQEVFSIEIDGDGRLIVKKGGQPVLDMGDIRGPKGDDGYVDPVINKEGQLYFRDKHGNAITSGATIKGEDGVAYEPVIDEVTGQLRFRNSKTGELRPGGFDIKGENGENGHSFIPHVSKDGKYLFFTDENGVEIPGQYTIRGEDGKNGREFVPHISDDGKELFFTDGEGKEIPGRYPIKGEEGKPGIYFYPEIDKDGYLSWKKVDGLIDASVQTPIKVKGEQGEPGITYRPFVKDGVLYWCDDKGNLIDDLDAARICGPEGKPGKEGPRGLSAYQIWRKQGYRGTEQDFLDFLKGEKGEPAPPANFSFKDVEDWTCPVQKIDTNLIVDSEKGSDSPEQIIEDRIKEIHDVREMGRERRNQSWFRKWFNWNVIGLCLTVLALLVVLCFQKYFTWALKDKVVIIGGLVVAVIAFLVLLIVLIKRSFKLKIKKDEKLKQQKGKKDKKETRKISKANRIGLLKEFAWWCAGADKDLLAMCPGDHTKYVGIGTVILFTALMAWFSSFIAMQLVFVDAVKIPRVGWMVPGKAIAAVFATFWSAMIFCLDRFITNTMYSDGKVTISRKEFMSGLPRIIIAIFLGIVISAPLELQIFKDEIDDFLKKDLLEKYTNDEVLKSDELAFANAEVKRAENDYDLARKDFEFYKILKTDSNYYAYYERKKQIESSTQGINTTTENPNNGEVTTSSGGGKSEYSYVPNYEKPLVNKWMTDSINAKTALDNAKTEYDSCKENVTSVKKQLIDNYDLDSALKKKGLYDRIHALHEIAMDGYEPWFEHTKKSDATETSLTNQEQEVTHQDSITKSDNDSTLLQKVDEAKSDLVSSDEKNETTQQSEQTNVTKKKDYNVFWDTVLHKWWWFLLSSPIGLIMLLFILIDISPVLYKMMLADGKYDNYLHQEKLLAQDKIRLSLAKMLKKLDDGELKRVSPFIMGDAYGKMAKEAYSYVNIEKKNKNKDIGKLDDCNVRGDYAAYYKLLMKEYQKNTGWRRIFPLSLVEWFVVKKKEEPVPPRIEFEEGKPVDSQAGQSQTNADSSDTSEPQKSKAKKKREDMTNEELLEDTNREVFDAVLDMKKKIILASYRRWYKTQHDCIICDDIEDENKGCEPFDDEAPVGDDTKIHIDDEGQDKDKFSPDDFTINKDAGGEKESSKKDDNASDNNTEDASQDNNGSRDNGNETTADEEEKKEEGEKAEQDDGMEKEDLNEKKQEENAQEEAEEDDGSDPDEQELPNDDGDDFPNE